MSGRRVATTKNVGTKIDERALTPVTAVAILVAVTVLVGAAGYFVLSDMSHATTTTAKSCSSANVTQCSDREMLGLTSPTIGQLAREGGGA
ncbi:MAG TPA: archaellin/type IV pilin N-terminal domain-containing protein [Thermoplasmata archaeon]|nr:archaellin/type IV pilin N-terminal domain-containing protein [Thermoplasmata archaeon]